MFGFSTERYPKRTYMITKRSWFGLPKDLYLRNLSVSVSAPTQTVQGASVYVYR